MQNGGNTQNANVLKCVKCVVCVSTAKGCPKLPPSPGKTVLCSSAYEREKAWSPRSKGVQPASFFNERQGVFTKGNRKEQQSLYLQAQNVNKRRTVTTSDNVSPAMLEPPPTSSIFTIGMGLKCRAFFHAIKCTTMSFPRLLSRAAPGHSY